MLTIIPKYLPENKQAFNGNGKVYTVPIDADRN
jgi:hypothetical protein